MPIKSTFCKAGVFRLSVLSAALAVALPCYGTTVVYTAKTPNDVVSNDFSYSSAADYGIYATGGNSVSFEGKSFYLDTTPISRRAAGATAMWVSAPCRARAGRNLS